jgi:PAS domain-containing protein
MRASKSSFGSASVTLVLLSVLAAGIIAFLGYSGFQLIRQESGAAESARRSVDEHRAVVESSPDAILVVDLENRITLANSRTAELFGFATAAAMLGMNILE